MSDDDATCQRAGCDKPRKAHGLCPTHYNREREGARHRLRDDRILPNRARTRAVSRLIEAHREDFDRLLTVALAEVTEEARILAVLAAAEGVELTGDGQVWRFRPGPRPDDEDPIDRLRTDDGRACPSCLFFHDGGHCIDDLGARASA